MDCSRRRGYTGASVIYTRGHNSISRTARLPPATPSPRELALVFLVLAPLGVLFAAVPPIAQDPAYHALADDRTFLGVRNFANVVSNAAFLIAGFNGLRLCVGPGVDGASRAWTFFFFGVTLIAFGSTWYHLNPTNNTLMWDRLPMTVSFMALFAALVSEHVRPDIERGLLRGAIAVGIFSVGWWHYTGDLRPYVWVQFAPLIALPFVVIAFPGRYSHRGYLMLGLLFYALAKAAEIGDAAVFSTTGGAVSGHSLKHLLAAGAPYCVYLMLRRRKPVAPSSS